MRQASVVLDDVTLATVLRVYLEQNHAAIGELLHGYTIKSGMDFYVPVGNAIITICGQINAAQKVFDSIHVKNLISWNAMMAAYAQNGLGKKVIETFEDMLKTECKPDHISYISVLSGYSHMGLIVEGKHYFKSMTKFFGISPTNGHFVCIVDVLGRAGMLNEAKELINEIPFKLNATVWGALLGSCPIHHESHLAEIALKNLVELNPEDSGNYVLLANIYAESGEIEGFANMKKLMKVKGIRNSPGCSWIEVDNSESEIP
nr:pentatricopeptide repeat-containing protein At2g13600-like [Arachis hypogaea]